MPTQNPTQWLQLHPADIADRLQRIDNPQQAIHKLRQLPTNIAAATLSELDPEFIQTLTPHLTQDELATLLRNLPHSESTDIVGELPETRQKQILDQLPTNIASPLRTLLQYPEDTAGGIMTDQYTALQANATVADALNHLRQPTTTQQPITYLYIIDPNQKLIGTISFRDLVLNKPTTTLKHITNRQVTRLQVTDDQEKIAHQFQHYHYQALPVVDTNNHLLGIVEANEIIQIAQEEATEDMQLMIGLSGEETALTPTRRALTKRLPWLYINLLTAIAAATIIALYENTIAQYATLAIFLPIIAGQAGNAGIQTLTIIIRSIALGELNPGDARRALIKETTLALINGATIGATIGIISWLWKNDPKLGLIAAIAMTLTQLTAALAGVLIPLTLRTLKIDPALASSILLTTLTDIGAFFFFLYLAHQTLT